MSTFSLDFGVDMIYCYDCELIYDENDVEPEWIDEDGTVWCPCGAEIQVIDPDAHPVYDTLEEKYL